MRTRCKGPPTGGHRRPHPAEVGPGSHARSLARRAQPVPQRAVHSIEDPPRGRGSGHRPEHLWLMSQHRPAADAPTTVGDHDRQIDSHAGAQAVAGSVAGSVGTGRLAPASARSHPGGSTSLSGSACLDRSDQLVDVDGGRGSALVMDIDLAVVLGAEQLHIVVD